MRALEALITAVAPSWGLQRAVAKAQVERLYQAAQDTHLRARPTDRRSPDSLTAATGTRLLEWSRYLDENHDIVNGALTFLAHQAADVTPRPMLRTMSGELATERNAEITALWREHRDTIALDGLPWVEASGLAMRAYLRDGEVFGAESISDAGYQLELVESDYCPLDLTTETPTLVIQGVEKDAQGRPVAYHFHRSHPQDLYAGARGRSLLLSDTRRVPADQVLHIATRRRLHQTRGVSSLHAVITRLDGLKDTEESEIVAARIAASLTVAITRGADFNAVTAGARSQERELAFEAGTVLDNLLPGETVTSIGGDRPNPAMDDFRRSQLRAASRSLGITPSTLSGRYDGTYSSQRQELVEAQPLYRRLRALVTPGFHARVWRGWVRGMILTGQFRPAGVDPETLRAVEFDGPSLPWIDPKKEIEADLLAIEGGLKSRHQVIRERGGDPARVDRELEEDTFEKPMAPEQPPLNNQGQDQDDEEAA